MWDFCTFVMGSHDIGEHLYVHVRSLYYQYILLGFESIRVHPASDLRRQSNSDSLPQQQSMGTGLHVPISRC